MEKRKNIGWPNEAWFVGQKTKVTLEFMTCRSRMRPYLEHLQQPPNARRAKNPFAVPDRLF